MFSETLRSFSSIFEYFSSFLMSLLHTTRQLLVTSNIKLPTVVEHYFKFAKKWCYIGGIFSFYSNTPQSILTRNGNMNSFETILILTTATRWFLCPGAITVVKRVSICNCDLSVGSFYSILTLLRLWLFDRSLF